MISSCSSSAPIHLPQTFSRNHNRFRIKNPPTARRGPTSSSFVCLRIGVEELAQVVQNKVLVSASVASAIGQFSKPFTSALYGRDVDFMAAFRSGGMPSTHSAGVVAAATALGVERGFSDSIFGMSVVFAAIVMYDAQGVRKEVGLHAKQLNRVALKLRENPKQLCEDGSVGSKQELSSINSEKLSSLLTVSNEVSSYNPSPTPSSLSRSRNIACRSNLEPSRLVINGEEEATKDLAGFEPLKESVGHTELEVLVGALLGFLISLIFESVL